MSKGVAAAVLTLGALAAPAGGPMARQASPDVVIVRTPAEGIQPQTLTDGTGVTHLVYFKGDPAKGDLFYTRVDSAAGRVIAKPVRVNTHPGSAIATGTVRGAHVAVGQGGRVHVAWMGSSQATPRAISDATPMLYARMNDAGTAFEAEQNVLQFATGLDGGGSIAADAAGRVYVVWHAGGPGSKGEADRRVWMARSTDNGRTFGREVAVSAVEHGACGCCGMRAGVDPAGTLFMLFRSATDMVHRDSYLLTSRDHGLSFSADKLHAWNVGACQMSTYALSSTRRRAFAAWETAGQVHWLSLDSSSAQRTAIVTPDGLPGTRKHPAIAATDDGQVLLVWTEGTGWNKGGSLAWQRYTADGRAIGPRGVAAGVATWSLGAATTLADGRFLVVY